MINMIMWRWLKKINKFFFNLSLYIISDVYLHIILLLSVITVLICENVFKNTNNNALFNYFM